MWLVRPVLSQPKHFNSVWGILMTVILLELVPAVRGQAGTLDAAVELLHYKLDIHRGSLNRALRELAIQTGMQVGHFSDAGANETIVGPLVGNYMLAEALDALLAGTGMAYRRVNPHTIAIVPAATEAGAPRAASKAPETNAPAFINRDANSRATAVPDSPVTERTETLHRGFFARLAGFFAVCVASTATDPVCAQETAASAEPQPQVLQEVVITGIRKSLETAQAIKQNSEQIVDSVTAQDIGALPDRSVSEALQRIPGVTLQRADANRDPQRLSSEGGGVFVRGLSWVRSELNGRDVFSATDGRAIGFEDVSADLLAGIDVYKNPQADMIEGGVGGLVNLRTRLPFDSHRQIIALSGDYNYADMRNKGLISGNALYSNSWETGIGRVGALVSGSIGNIGNRTDAIQLGNYVAQTLATSADDDPVGSTVLVPNQLHFTRIDWQQRRVALSGALQWRPSDKWLLTLEAFQAKTNPHFTQFDASDQGYYLGNSAAQYTNLAGGIVTAGVVPAQPQLFTTYNIQHHTTNDFSINLKFEPMDRLKFTGDVQYIKSHSDTAQMSLWTEPGGHNCDGSGADGNYATITLPNGSTCSSSTGGYDQNGNSLMDTMTFNNIAGTSPSMVLQQSPNQMANQSIYWWYAAMDHLEDNDAHSWAERLDGDFKFENNAWLDSFRFGVRATDKQAITRETGWNWALLSHAYWGGGTAAYFNQSPASMSQYVSFSDFMRGTVAAPGGGWFPSQQLVTQGSAYAYSVLKATETPGTGAWTPLTTNWANATAGTDNPLSGVNNQGEHTYAGYLLLKFRHNETPLGRMDGNIGVRIVHTAESSGVGYTAVGVPPSISNCLAQNSAAACQFVVTAATFDAGGKQYQAFPSNTYTDVLPTLNVRFLLEANLQLRFALGKAIVRPSFGQMNPFTTLAFNFAPDGHSPAAVNPLTGSGGNPELKPTRANQLDTSLEWYFAPTGSITFAAFYKDVHDYIFSGTASETYTSNGVTQTFLVTRNMNGSKGRIRGFELGYQQFYDFLPPVLHGFGLAGNLTLVDSSGGRNTAPNPIDAPELAGANDTALPLEGLSRWSYNAAAMYEAHRVSARLAWNWRERYLLTSAASNLNAPVWSGNYGQLDGEVFYTLNDHLKVGLQGTNLLKARTYLDIGTAALAPRYSWTDTDSRYALAVRAQF
jgi:TonB-dependent receptor